MQRALDTTLRWKKLPIPWITERITAFSLPQKKQVIVMDDHDGFILTLDPPYDVHEFSGAYRQIRKNLNGNKKSVLEYKGTQYPLLGLMGGAPILQSAFKERLHLTLMKEKTTLLCFFTVCHDRDEVFRYEFYDLSGDWTFVTFNNDFQYILLGNPYELSIFQRVNE